MLRVYGYIDATKPCFDNRVSIESSKIIHKRMMINTTICILGNIIDFKWNVQSVNLLIDKFTNSVQLGSMLIHVYYVSLWSSFHVI